MLDRITGMRIFVRAVSAGSLSAAGRHLGISPAMATKHVDALEAHLGVKLLHRTTRRLSLTEAGSDYLEACLRILPEIEEAEASAASQRVEARGLLRMNVPLTFGSRYIAPLVPAFSQRHPAVRVELGLNDSQVDLIDGGWDMAVRIGRLADSTLQARRLADCPLVVCAAPAYLDERGVPRKVADLAQHNCLSYTLSQSKDWAFGRDGNTRVTVNGDLLANNGSALVAAAVGGQGIIYQPQFIVAGALRRGELVVLELDKPAMDVGGIHLLYPPDRRPPAKVRVMADYLIESFKDEVPWALA
ncbi:LysR family transcriptional regulator [Stutzerimonas nitrititolerans]|uniref:LysR family transcriptional regulator n=1 Tax=Stutzerimonas nitrititolerans TaxID=2482751 RepID=UPI00289DF733|nr:LysR family transcriptional regulator [Stutzerimonas nitrititolerans]